MSIYAGLGILIFITWFTLTIIPDTILSSFILRWTIEFGDTQRIEAGGIELLTYEIDHIIQSGKPILFTLFVFVFIWAMLWKIIFKKSLDIQQPYVSKLKKITKGPDVLILVPILLIATLIRLLNINQSFWLDELVSVSNYFGKVPFSNTFIAQTFNNHIFYSIWAHISGFLLGHAEWTYRLPSLLFGLGGIWAITKFAIHVGNRRIIFISAMLLAFSPLHIDQSQQARGYTLLVLCVIVSSHLFLRLFKEDNKNIWLQFIIVTILGMWTHLYMSMVLISQLSVVLVGTFVIKQGKFPLVDFKTTSRFMLATTLIGLVTVLLYVPSLPYMIFSTFRDASPVSNVNQSFILQIIGALGSGEKCNICNFLPLILFLIGFVQLWQKQKILLLYTATTFIVPICLIMILQPVFLYSRFFIFLLPLYIIIIANGIEAIVNYLPFRQNNLLSVSILFILIGYSIPSIITIVNRDRQNYREGAQLINQYNPNDTVIIVPGYAEKEILYYTPNFRIVEPKTINEIDLLATQYKNLLFFATFNYNIDNNIINYIKTRRRHLITFRSIYSPVILYEIL